MPWYLICVFLVQMKVEMYGAPEALTRINPRTFLVISQLPGMDQTANIRRKVSARRRVIASGLRANFGLLSHGHKKHGSNIRAPNNYFL